MASKTIKTINLEEETAIYKALSDFRYKCAFFFLLNTGLRVGEFCQLRIEDLIYLGKPVKFLVVRAEIAKNATAREIPINIKAGTAISEMQRVYWLKRHFQANYYAWNISTPERPLSPRALQLALAKAGKSALNRGITPHMLRHTFATRTMKNADSRIVQQLLGHCSLATTQIYTHPSRDDCKTALDRL